MHDAHRLWHRTLSRPFVTRLHAQQNGSRLSPICVWQESGRRIPDWLALDSIQTYFFVGDFFTEESSSTDSDRLRPPHKRPCAHPLLASEGLVFRRGLPGLQKMRQQGW